MVKVLEILKHRLTKKQKFFIWLFVFLFCAFLLLNYLTKNVNPIIISVSEAKVRSLSMIAMNNAITKLTSDEELYTDLVKIQEDETGKITLIQANVFAINNLTNQIMGETQTELEDMGDVGISIPIGSFSGLPVLNGLGPKVTIRLLPVGNVQCNFVSEFTSAGINQTSHKIFVNLEAKVSLVLPLATKQVTTDTQILICESIIVGSVPEVYLQATSLDEMLNLVPVD